MDQPNAAQLTLEQQLELRKLQDSLCGMDTEEIKARLCTLYKDLIIKEELYKRQLKRAWGIEVGWLD